MTEHIIIDGKPEPYDRWQHLEHIAYAIDGAPGQEVDLLSALLESFPECSPNDDWPGYAVRHLLESLLLNRGYRLRRDRTVTVPHPSNGPESTPF